MEDFGSAGKNRMLSNANPASSILTSTQGIPEKKWMTAMGAEYDDLDVLTRPLLSSKDFLDRITKWLQSVDATGSRDRAIIGVFSNQLQAAAKTMNWKGIVEDACER